MQLWHSNQGWTVEKRERYLCAIPHTHLPLQLCPELIIIVLLFAVAFIKTSSLDVRHTPSRDGTLNQNQAEEFLFQLFVYGKAADPMQGSIEIIDPVALFDALNLPFGPPFHFRPVWLDLKETFSQYGPLRVFSSFLKQKLALTLRFSP